jgi:hypothetical protein
MEVIFLVNGHYKGSGGGQRICSHFRCECLSNFDFFGAGGWQTMECAVATETSGKMAALPNGMFRTILRPRAGAMRVTTESRWLCHLADDRRVT